jgi:hypothetical protein
VPTAAPQIQSGPQEDYLIRDDVKRLWPELDWIQNADLREKVTRTWERAFELSPLRPDDLNQIPFTLLVPNCPTTFMEHKRCVMHISRHSANTVRIASDSISSEAIFAGNAARPVSVD